MIVVDTEPSQHRAGGWRWYLLHLETNQRVCTGATWFHYQADADAMGEAVLAAVENYPVHDTTEDQP